MEKVKTTAGHIMPTIARRPLDVDRATPQEGTGCRHKGQVTVVPHILCTLCAPVLQANLHTLCATKTMLLVTVNRSALAGSTLPARIIRINTQHVLDSLPTGTSLDMYWSTKGLDIEYLRYRPANYLFSQKWSQGLYRFLK